MIVTPSIIKTLVGSNFDKDLAAAQADQESDFDSTATRFEQGVYDKLVKTNTPADARILSTSWGIFQIMGYNLKNMGYPVLNQEWRESYLNDIPLQVQSYIKFSKPLFAKYGSLNPFLADYNGGPGAVDALKTRGYYGAAEKYVYEVKNRLGLVTDDDLKRYNLWFSEKKKNSRKR